MGDRGVIKDYGIRSLLWKLTSLLKQSPRIYLPLARFQKRVWDGSPKTLNLDTELVIDAFPRSANTFAFHAFRLTQPWPVKVAHHFHAAAVIIAAVQRKIPVFTIIRAPENAVISYLIYRRTNDIAQAMRDYIRYYTVVEKYRSQLFLARFESVTNDYGSVIHALNKRFGTHFVAFEHTEENVQKVYKQIELIEEKFWHQQNHQSMKKESWALSPRPDQRRENLQERLKHSFYNQRYAVLRERSQTLYERLEKTADI
jgi:hypothetical protein